ncbi:MAG: NAD-dependent epimerase/dehydratase family protein [Pirellulales bacterium]
MRRTLVTGSTGLVGNNVCRLLLERGDHVRVLARSTSDPRPLAGLEIERFEGDIRNRDEVARAVSGVERVIHCAAHIHLGWKERDFSQQVNVVGTRNVAEAARQANAKLVHVSTVDALAIGHRDRPADEEMPPVGAIPCTYVVTKRAAEEVIDAEVARGLHATIVNPGFMLGPWDWKPSSGRMVIEVARRFTPVAPSGGCSVCDVRDVAAGILSAAERGQAGRRYILAGENLTYFDLWRRIARMTGGRGPLVRLGPANGWLAGAVGDLAGQITGREPTINSAAIAMSSQYHYYSSDRARRELGYSPRPADDAIRVAWDWLRQHHGW